MNRYFDSYGSDPRHIQYLVARLMAFLLIIRLLNFHLRNFN